MAKISITVNGKAYPCRPTMGAMLRFKRETGKEVTEIDGSSLSDVLAYLWCCVASACKADGVEFGMPLMDFADAIDPEDVAGWLGSTSAGASDGGEKKSPSKSKRR